ncbi:MAG TPA: LLM class F420-dependent oxidoreductase [Acidimicrobiales bacterium]|nr:LLM class F420-dependent oxidoreductase [Acidimicrobiales bacterium]
MKIGVGFPYEAIGTDPDVYRAYARRAEELGFHHMTFIDHVLGAEHARRDPPFEGPYTEESVFHEPLTLISWLAASTERLELCTTILILAQRQTALVAKQAAEIQVLSGGRLRLGLGTGWNFVEYESLGIPFAQRGARLEEQVEVLRKLWTEPVLDYTGRFHRIDRAGQRPLLGSMVPIWFGGFSDAQQDRCARLGDGFVFMRMSRLSLSAIGKIRDRAEEVGRDPDALGFEAPAGGTGRELTGAIEQWEAAGGTHVTVQVPGEAGGLLGGLSRVARDLGELLSGS